MDLSFQITGYGEFRVSPGKSNKVSELTFGVQIPSSATYIAFSAPKPLKTQLKHAHVINEIQKSQSSHVATYP